ncbi:MAG: NUDIX hydrolase [Thermoanaerobaculia bacterium]|nr:NUDIX hydrolase [Thermoanaerobaculia bacterium]
MTAGPPASRVEAAGGVVVRVGAAGPELVAVHRPRYDDWSLPKGKLDPGEGHREAALREVEEETGLVCRAVEELEPVEYLDARGRPKRVRYWRMEVASGRVGARSPDREVDAVRWLDAAAAARLLSYDHDRELAARALASAT